MNPNKPQESSAGLEPIREFFGEEQAASDDALDPVALDAEAVASPIGVEAARAAREASEAQAPDTYVEPNSPDALKQAEE